jgi:hypothetical protein
MLFFVLPSNVWSFGAEEKDQHLQSHSDIGLINTGKLKKVQTVDCAVAPFLVG